MCLPARGDSRVGRDCFGGRSAALARPAAASGGLHGGVAAALSGPAAAAQQAQTNCVLRSFAETPALAPPPEGWVMDLSGRRPFDPVAWDIAVRQAACNATPHAFYHSIHAAIQVCGVGGHRAKRCAERAA